MTSGAYGPSYRSPYEGGRGHVPSKADVANGAGPQVVCSCGREGRESGPLVGREGKWAAGWVIWPAGLLCLFYFLFLFYFLYIHTHIVRCIFFYTHALIICRKFNRKITRCWVKQYP